MSDDSDFFSQFESNSNASRIVPSIPQAPPPQPRRPLPPPKQQQPQPFTNNTNTTTTTMPITATTRTGNPTMIPVTGTATAVGNRNPTLPSTKPVSTTPPQSRTQPPTKGTGYPHSKGPTQGTGSSYYGSSGTSVTNHGRVTTTATAPGEVTSSYPRATTNRVGGGSSSTTTSNTSNPSWNNPQPNVWQPHVVATQADTTVGGYPQVSSSTDWYTSSSTTATGSATHHPSLGTSTNTPYPMAGSSSTNPYANYAYGGGTGLSTTGSSTSFSDLSGAMDATTMNATNATTGGASLFPSMKMFMPVPNTNGTGDPTTTGGASGAAIHDSECDFENEPPLLEELGINIPHIIMKTKAVVVPFQRMTGGSGGNTSGFVDPAVIIEDADLAGPLALALLLGLELLVSVKLSFGYIYGFGLAGCLSMTLILNLMSPSQAISFWTVTSVLGYALLPVNVLAAVKLVVQNLAGQETLTRIMAVLTILWSTTASTRLLEIGCGMRQQRYLMAYPIALLYTAFVLITIF